MRKKNEKLNKSYALIKFKQQGSKNYCLSHDMRLFGMRIGAYLCHTEDADKKTSIVLNNLPWGT